MTCRVMASLARYFRLTAVLPVALLLGCVTLTPTTRAHPHATVLFSVTLKGDLPPDRQPAGLIVSVEAKQGSAGGQFAFTPYSRVPGHYTTFLVRLDLPAEHYRLSRLSVIANDGMPMPQFDLAPRMAFDLRNGTADYIGHIELTVSRSAAEPVAASARIVIADAYDEELPYFAHAWPSLSAHAIRRRAPRGATAIAAQPLTQQSESGSSPPAAAAQAVARLDERAASGLPPRAQAAFRSFLRGSYPRAFAVSVAGYTGTASGGRDVIGRALDNCKRAQRIELARRAGAAANCRLFALDNTLLSSVNGAESARSLPTGRKVEAIP
jgi:hypothetical protein